jgi:hypothetical protein
MASPVLRTTDCFRAFYIVYRNRRVNETRNTRTVQAYGCAAQQGSSTGQCVLLEALAIFIDLLSRLSLEWIIMWRCFSPQYRNAATPVSGE